MPPVSVTFSRIGVTLLAMFSTTSCVPITIDGDVVGPLGDGEHVVAGAVHDPGGRLDGHAEVSFSVVPVSAARVCDSVASAVMSAASVALLPLIVPVTVPPVLLGLVPVATRLPVILSPLSE